MTASRRTCLALTAAFAVTYALPAAAAGKPPEQDRASILAMAGDYKVRFDMRETVPFVSDYKPLEPKRSGGYESVRVIEDRGDFISLQHMLVVEGEDKKPVVVKHWRQDWTFQPARVVVYESAGRWVLKAVPAAQRNGAWSQTVWQTDDSPRYGGVGKWAYDHGVARWQSDETLRPLARRDAVRHPIYTWYVGVNRHALTPTGWVHEQDNAKVGERDGKPVTYVHEVVVNTYEKFNGYPVAAADDYWARTKGYWADVRTAWDAAIAKDGGVRVTEEAQNGSVTGPKLMGLADEIAEGKMDVAKASAEAKALIAGAEKARPLASR
ncbi:DUF6607 family protein [Phenylobacterium sp.]|uniref:DUF6607 family protein n=1 Tax=Phenylobacterium sp. TaxID=1871053 RepID=UPI0025ECF675|nr:DUF6607 family protein [Phenylobacterium sp.]MBX3482664.1 hypothetical protein [Phenylobacterium sp.]